MLPRRHYIQFVPKILETLCDTSEQHAIIHTIKEGDALLARLLNQQTLKPPSDASPLNSIYS